jgi:tol-pal system protein YbgF
LLAALAAGLTITGCATKRDVNDIRAQISAVERQNSRIEQYLSRMDSIIADGMESNNKMRNDVTFSMNELETQLAQLLAGYNDLVQRLDQMNQQPTVIRRPPTSSPGSQPSTQADTAASTPAMPEVAEPAIDCDSAWGDAFLLVRKGDYQTAIDGFRTYMANCPSHQSMENAHYWIGECYYAQEQFDYAISEFDLLLEKYPSSANVSRAMYKKARSLQELGRPSEAKKLFEKIIADHPGTLEADQSKERLKDI